ncbi:dynein regulatory complex subunit 4-like [Octopus sinensis]|uniref:Dynein regulatory complex subunit 4 n=1 Tax=Octopus sinensis TaxID=2607531 RepID=A0A6P7U051_9MOLL|nr:dynein regulatory complex subunit 4-like [Octopus sinensis]
MREEYDSKEGDLVLQKSELKTKLRESELSYEDVVKNLKLVFLVNLFQSRDEREAQMKERFDGEIRKLEEKYTKKLKIQREEMDLLRKNEINQVEERKNTQINVLMKNHEKAFSDIKNYYNDITLNNLALINTLKACRVL